MVQSTFELFKGTNGGVSGQSRHKRYYDLALPGMTWGMGSCVSVPHMNTVGNAATYTITVPATVDNDTYYSVTIDGVTVGVTTDADATQAELAAALFDALRQDGEIGRNTISLASNVITVESRLIGEAMSVSANTGATTNDLVIAQTVAPTVGSVIPFGRFVGRLSSYSRNTKDGTSQASLINHASNFTLLGVTLSTHFAQSQQLPATEDGYPFGHQMNVLKDTGSLKGVWAETSALNLAIGDSVYIDVTAGNEGKITNVSSGNMDVSSLVSVVVGANSSLSTQIALIKFELS